MACYHLFQFHNHSRQKCDDKGEAKCPYSRMKRVGGNHG